MPVTELVADARAERRIRSTPLLRFGDFHRSGSCAVMDIVARSIELLNTSVPDTFLGRQRHPSPPEPEL
jgi:hypothetical protein